jgi:hypothetical protein
VLARAPIVLQHNARGGAAEVVVDPARRRGRLSNASR